MGRKKDIVHSCDQERISFDCAPFLESSVRVIISSDDGQAVVACARGQSHVCTVGLLS